MAGPGTKTTRRRVNRCLKHAFAPSPTFGPRIGDGLSRIAPAQVPKTRTARARFASDSSVAGGDPVNNGDPTGDECSSWQWIVDPEVCVVNYAVWGGSESGPNTVVQSYSTLDYGAAGYHNVYLTVSVYLKIQNHVSQFAASISAFVGYPADPGQVWETFDDAISQTLYRPQNGGIADQGDSAGSWLYQAPYDIRNSATGEVKHYQFYVAVAKSNNRIRTAYASTRTSRIGNASDTSYLGSCGSQGEYV
jgi:hypothetical protein